MIFRKSAIGLMLMLTLIVSAVGSYFYFKSQPGYRDNVLGGSTVTTDSQPYELKEAPKDLNTLNILLLGFGGAGHEGGFLTDVIQIAHIDFSKSEITFISIPRDLWVNLPQGSSAKVNTAFTLGNDPNDKIGSGAEVAKVMAQVITGLNIDYYIAIDFVGYKRAVGYTLEGIEVDVPETLHDPWYPIEGEQLNPCGMTPEEIADITAKYSGFELEKQFPCRYKELYYPAGKNFMEGEDALNYVRSRHGSGSGDFSRSQRQVAVLKAVRKKLFSLDVFANLPNFFKDVTQHTHSDIDWSIAENLAPALKNSLDYEIKQLILSTDNVFNNSRSDTGQFILVPKSGSGNWQDVHQYIGSNL